MTRVAPPFVCRIASILAALACCTLLARATESQVSRRVFVAVVDASGEPVRGLTAADFTVHAGDRALRVLSAAPAADPPAIVVVTDGVDVRQTVQAREAMRAIASAAREQSAAARVGVAGVEPGAAVRMLSLAEDEAQVERAIARFAGSDETWPLLESVLAATAALAQETSPRRIIVALSRRHDPPAEVIDAAREADALRRTGTALWAIDLGWSGVLADVAPRSGGRHVVARQETLAAEARRIMQAVESQYVVTYALTDDDGPLRVGVRRAGAIVLAPAWAPR
jgi:hypothetical protein